MEVFKPVGAPSPFIWASDWRVIAQATPDAVPAQNPTAIQAYSNAENSYDSTSAGKKIIIKYEKSFELGTPYPVLYLGETATAGGVKLRYVAPNGVSTQDLTLWLRVRPIMADWDPATITWNNHAGNLTLGSVIHVSKPVNIWANVGWCTFESYPGAYESYSLCCNYQQAGKIYGVIVDVQPTAGQAAQFNSRYAQFYIQANVRRVWNNPASLIPKPHIYVPTV